MDATKMKLLLGSGALAVAFLGGVALAPGFAGAAAAQLGGGQTATTAQLGDDLDVEVDERPAGDLLKAAADYIGITTDQLRTEMGGDKSMADVAIAHGKTRDGLIQALVNAATTDIQQLVDRKGFPAPRAELVGLRTGIQAASDYLGIGAKDLITQLRSGKALGQIADATSGKSRQGLIDAIVAAESKAIDQAVAGGKLTQAQADQMKANLTTRVTTFVDATRPRMDDHPGPGFGSGPGGRSGKGGGAPQPTQTP